MPRPIVAEARTHRAIRDRVATRNADIVREVQQAVLERRRCRHHATETACQAGSAVSPGGSAAGTASRARVGTRFDRLIVSGELSRLLTKQANNAGQVCSVSTTLTGTRYAP